MLDTLMDLACKLAATMIFLAIAVLCGFWIVMVIKDQMNGGE